ncbi:hypothetical protein EVAR_78695_1 [Eumeta japonica]|uniref:Uncharacterized protein n=1 Tax=Eumeta variegata TaxID=151549 RepID=A0A4C2ACJ9_EUMVA|nr:hypothetical protein EVAR_78695_1 [Eumeta japonica]
MGSSGVERQAPRPGSWLIMMSVDTKDEGINYMFKGGAVGWRAATESSGVGKGGNRLSRAIRERRSARPRDCRLTLP